MECLCGNARAKMSGWYWGHYIIGLHGPKAVHGDARRASLRIRASRVTRPETRMRLQNGRATCTESEGFGERDGTRQITASKRDCVRTRNKITLAH